MLYTTEERDQLGLIKERCPHCEACLYLSDEDAATGHGTEKAICLNGCRLPGYLWKRLHSLPGGLIQDAARVGSASAPPVTARRRHKGGRRL